MEFLFFKFVSAMIAGLFTFIVVGIIMILLFGDKAEELTLLISGSLSIFAGYTFSNYLENKYNDDFAKELKAELNKKTLVCDHFVITEPEIDFDKRFIFDKKKRLMFEFKDCELVELEKE